MRKITKVLVLIILGLFITPVSLMSANEDADTSKTVSGIDKDYVENYANDIFASADTTKKILETPEGAFIQGKEIVYADDGTIMNIYDSETNTKSITVAEAKERVKQSMLLGNPGLSAATRGSSVPGKEGERVLGYTNYHLSEPFTTPGWRVSNLKFMPAPGTGTYLRWTSFTDSGLAGNTSQCINTIYSGSLQGAVLNVGAAQYVNCVEWIMYYTFNPIAGTRYLVENI